MIPYRKAQVTIFIFLGLLIVLSIVMIIFITQNNNNTMQERTAQALSQTTMRPIKNYVDSCLNTVADDAFELLSTQGLALYESQGGTYPDPTMVGEDHLVYDGKKVTFLLTLLPENSIVVGDKTIISNSLSQSEVFDNGNVQVLVYPWSTFPEHPFDPQESTAYVNSAFGWNTLPPLNRIGEHSIEEQVEGYVKEHMKSCTQWGQFPQFTITTDEPRVEVLFGPQSTIITLKWHVRMEDDNGRVGTMDSFITSRRIQLAKLHNTINRLIDQDAGSLSFKMKEHNTPYEIYVEYQEGGSIVRIIDQSSLLHDEPYEIRFARMNRPPALERIDQDALLQQRIEGCSGLQITHDTTPGTNAFVVETGSSRCQYDKRVPFIAEDPDEDDITFDVTDVSGKYSEKPTPTRELTADDLRSTCVWFIVSATDGQSQDWQRIHLRRLASGSCI